MKHRLPIQTRPPQDFHQADTYAAEYLFRVQINKHLIFDQDSDLVKQSVVFWQRKWAMSRIKLYRTPVFPTLASRLARKGLCAVWVGWRRRATQGWPSPIQVYPRQWMSGSRRKRPQDLVQRMNILSESPSSWPLTTKVRREDNVPESIVVHFQECHESVHRCNLWCTDMIFNYSFNVWYSMQYLQQRFCLQ